MPRKSNSALDDIVGAFASVGRTLLAIALAAFALVAGLFQLAIGVVLWAFSWVGYKLRLSKIPPRARFQRLQMWLVGKYVQHKLRKAGISSPSGSAPFSDMPGGPDMSHFFQGPMAEMFEQMQSDAQRVRNERAAGVEPGQTHRDVAVEETQVASSAKDEDDTPEVVAEDIGEYQGSIEDLVRRRRG
ncbi:MAG: hypothetical protein MK209_04840 [Planctomycetes bacterium]|nr:hypothetical protein [Planctomycetota bacterium]